MNLEIIKIDTLKETDFGNIVEIHVKELSEVKKHSIEFQDTIIGLYVNNILYINGFNKYQFYIGTELRNEFGTVIRMREFRDGFKHTA